MANEKGAPDFVNCNVCMCYQGCQLDGTRCCFKNTDEWNKHLINIRRYDEESNAMHEHYYPKYESEDDQIINAECDRNGIARP